MKGSVGLFCAASERIDAAYGLMAEEFGRRLGRLGLTLIYGGTNSGLMERAALGAKSEGGRVVGVVPRLVEMRRKVSTHLDETVHCADLNERKAVMLERSDVFVALPGGVGTLDEVFTVMASHSIGYHRKMVILFDLNGFWDSLVNVLHEMDSRGFVNVPLADYLVVARTWEELTEALERVLGGGE